MDGSGYRRLDTSLASEFADAHDRACPFDDHAGRALVALKRRPMGERHAKGAVARVLGGTGDDEVAHAGKTHAGHGISSHRVDDAAHLGKATGHEHRQRVVPKARPRADAAGDGNDVLDRRADSLDRKSVV